MSDLIEIKTILESQEKALGEKFTRYEAELKETGSVAASVKADLKSMADDFKSVQDELQGIKQKGVKLEREAPALSMGAQFVQSDSFKNYREGKSNKAKVEFKNTIIGEGGSPQNPTNDIVPLQTMPGIVGGAFRGLRILDAIPQGVATGNTVHYTRELLFTNNAAEKAEGTQKPESVLTFEGVDVPVRTIAHFLKVSKQVLDDAPALQSYIDSRMRYGVQLRVEQQIVNGNGTSPNLSGILDSGNYTVLTANSADNDLDFANRAKYAVIASDYMPSFYMINPADWGRIERLKKGTGDASYIGAEGAVAYLQNGLVPTLWGLPVIASNSVPASTLVCMSSDAVMFWNRQGTTVEIFDQNEDDVEKNLLTIRGEARGAFTVFRPAAVVAGTLPDA